MTNKEAINELRNIKGYGQVLFTEMDTPNNLAYMSQALDTAIEAIKENEKLKQELKEVKQELATFKALC